MLYRWSADRGDENGPTVELRDVFVDGLANENGSNFECEESEGSALGINFEDSEEDIGVDDSFCFEVGEERNKEGEVFD